MVGPRFAQRVGEREPVTALAVGSHAVRRARRDDRAGAARGGHERARRIEVGDDDVGAEPREVGGGL